MHMAHNSDDYMRDKVNLPHWASRRSGKEPACQCRRRKRHRFNPWVRKIHWRRAWQPTPVFFPGESHGQRSLVGYSLWDRKESDLTEATQPACMCIGVGDINHDRIWQRP